MQHGEDPLCRPGHLPPPSMASHTRTTTDIRKRMDDVYHEMDQNARGGRLRMPLKFITFHSSDVLYQFTRAAVGYALSYVKLKTLEHVYAARARADELAKFHASQQQNQCHHDTGEEEDHHHDEDLSGWQQRMHDAIASQGACATQLAETYARLVLHCSNFEHHKEDERFFECVYYFVCAVVKVGVSLDHWQAIENELGFLFRGAQFSTTIQRHAAAKTQREQAAAAVAAAVAASEAASGANTAAKKIQNLSAAGVLTKDTNATHRDGSLFVLPTVPSTRCCFFPASLPVSKIVSELDAAKVRATRNIGISQTIRERMRATRDDAYERRQLDALVSPRVGVRLDYLKEQERTALEISSRSERSGASATLNPQKPRRRLHGGSGSPRLSMKAAITSRSPAVNHLLPGTEDRVRLSLEEYERSFQQTLQKQKLKAYTQRQLGLDSSLIGTDLSSIASTVSTVKTPTEPRLR